MEITKPTLILDKEICIGNIAFMAAKAKHFRQHFRPHFKTHQSAIIGEWFKEYEVKAITVSSVSMAKYFAAQGWDDITVAFPMNLLEIEEINQLATKIILSLLADNIITLEFLEKNLTSRVGLFIKIDTAYHRAGIAWDNTEEITGLLDFLSGSSKLEFKGFLTHSGHSYNTHSVDEINAVQKDTLFKMSSLKLKYFNRYPKMIISIGDTPCCSVCEDFAGADEIRPGNFVFYDLMQYYLGACNITDIAVSVACPVVSVNIKRNEFIIYGGAVHFSKESVIDNHGRKIFGIPVIYNQHGWGKPIEDSYVEKLSQEHGIIKTNPDFIRVIQPGKLIGILPVHSCLTAHQLQNYYNLEGTKIAEINN